MGRELFIVDAFADTAFTGNPAAVCLLDRLLDQDCDSNWMQAVAAEMNLSETAFLLPLNEGEWALRWFTPTTEVDLCGHGTLAAAHVLWREAGHREERLRFQTRSGWLIADREEGRIGLDFPADPPLSLPPDERISAALGSEPISLFRGREDLMACFAKAEEVYRLAPDMERLAGLDARGIIVTAASDQAEYDFISRFFAPAAGIPEDPVTGAAHCTLGPYWGERLGRSTLRGYQASRRGGVVEVRLMNQRVKLLGTAMTTLKGVFHG
jgi:PhzF family phenazine biosynthesis protein